MNVDMISLQQYADMTSYSRARLSEICTRYSVVPDSRSEIRGQPHLYRKVVLEAMISKHHADCTRKGKTSQLKRLRPVTPECTLEDKAVMYSKKSDEDIIRARFNSYEAYRDAILQAADRAKRRGDLNSEIKLLRKFALCEPVFELL